MHVELQKKKVSDEGLVPLPFQEKLKVFQNK